MTVQVTVDPFHLGSVFALRTLFRGADPAAPPSIHLLRPIRSVRSVALLPGSFNPPTAAHLMLAERALAEGFDAVVFLLARRTVGKTQLGMTPEDRLMAMHAIAGSTHGVAVSSHGLYSDQAAAAREVFPDAELSFLVGSDKVLQIFDPRWYDDRDAALDVLFDSATVMAAPRSDQGEALSEVLNEDCNRRWCDRVEVLRLHPAVGDLSSTRVRGLLRAGADPNGLVPPPVASLIEQTMAFGAPTVVGLEEVDAYLMRSRLIDLIWRTRGTAGAEVDLHRLFAIALSPTAAGRRLRATLADARAGAGALHDLQAMAAGL